MFFARYNLDVNLEVVDKYLKELAVKFNNSNLIEDDGSKTCILDKGDVDGTRETHIIEKITTFILERFEDFFGRHTMCSPIEQRYNDV